MDQKIMFNVLKRTLVWLLVELTLIQLFLIFTLNKMRIWANYTDLVRGRKKKIIGQHEVQKRITEIISLNDPK